MIDLVSKLRMRKVKVIEIPKWGTYLRKQWEENFANHLSKNERKSIYLYNGDVLCGYLWHVFSYERKECLKEGQAEKAFHREKKQFCYIFYQHTNDALIVENASLLKADDFIKEEDIYVVDKGFTWTYVKTHEAYCGPYFAYSNNNGKKL